MQGNHLCDFWSSHGFSGSEVAIHWKSEEIRYLDFTSISFRKHLVIYLTVATNQAQFGPKINRN